MRFKAAIAPLGLWLVGLLVCLAVIVQTRFVTDLSAFMPKTPNARQQLLIDQLRDGAVARLVLMGIEGGDPDERAHLSRALGQALQQSGLFVSVQNGDEATLERDRAYFFDNRYLLSPAVTPQRFEVDGLRAAIEGSIDALSGEAGMTIKRLFSRDPTGETLQLLDQFVGTDQPQNLHGVWASRDGSRALLLAFTRASGSDTDAQSQAVQAVRAAFAVSSAGHANIRLIMSGAGVSSAASRQVIETEVSRLAIASLILVMGLLLLVYRSVWLLALGILPVLTGVAAGVAAVSMVFGQVHGLTLGFGTTLTGEAVDYAIYFFVQRSAHSDSRRFWRTIWLGMLTSAVGFAALLSSSFPGLAQLGLYSIAGLVAAVLVTRYVLPVLSPEHVQLRDLSQASQRLDIAIGRATRLRWPLLVGFLCAGAVIYSHDGDIWNRQLSGLNPLPQAERSADEQLRADLGGTDSQYILAFTAPDQEQALQQAERVGAVLDALMEQQVLAGFSSPATVLPSMARQQARQAALPEMALAAQRLVTALQELPVQANRLQGFLDDVQRARTQPLLTRESLDGTAIELLVETTLISRQNDVLVLMPLRPPTHDTSQEVITLDRVHSAMQQAGLNGISVIDLVEESRSLFEGYRHEILVLTGGGGLLILVLLMVALRSVLRTLRVAVPLVGAVLCVMAGLLLQGTPLTILHLVGLLLVVAIGSNYALFFDRGARNGETQDRQQSQVSLLVANLTTVGSFGLLGMSEVPVLAAIGTTVAPGAFLALVFAAILTREIVFAYPD